MCALSMAHSPQAAPGIMEATNMVQKSCLGGAPSLPGPGLPAGRLKAGGFGLRAFSMLGCVLCAGTPLPELGLGLSSSSVPWGPDSWSLGP